MNFTNRTAAQLRILCRYITSASSGQLQILCASVVVVAVAAACYDVMFCKSLCIRTYYK